MSQGIGNVVYEGFNGLGAGGAAIANNGLSVFGGTTIQLGGLLGAAGAAVLLNNREIPFGGNFSLTLSGMGAVAGSRLNFRPANAVTLEPQIMFQDNLGNDLMSIRTGANSDFGTYIGLNAGLVATGSANIFIGPNAGRSVTTGTVNIGIGSSTLRGSSASAISGNRNCVVGGDGFNTGASALGNGNTGLGSNNMDSGNAVGDFNICIGAFNNNSIGGAVGSFNIVIGNAVGVGNTLNNSTIICPSGTGASTLNLSNVCVLGDNTQNVIIGMNILTVVDNGSRLQLLGSLSTPRRTTAVNTTLTAADFTLILTAGGLVVTLPTAAAGANRIYAVVNQAAASTFNINYTNFAGAAVNAIAANAAIWIQSDGTNWIRIV